MKVVIKKSLATGSVGGRGSSEEARFEIAHEEGGEPLGYLTVSSDGLGWRAPGLVGERLMPWQWFSATMTNNEDDKIERLMVDCGLVRAYATALVRSGGRCEYCGRDILGDRFGYGVSTLDHLIPTSKCSEDVAENESNWVFCCGMCNSTKHDWDPRDPGMPIASPDDLRRWRPELVSRARTYVYERLATIHDPSWLSVLAVMEERSTE